MAGFVVRRRQHMSWAATFVGIAIVSMPLAVWAAGVTLPHVFNNGTIADANEVNANFDALNIGLATHETDAAAHHTKTTDASELSSGTLEAGRLPATVSLLGTGIATGELEFDPATQTELNGHIAVAANQYVSTAGDSIFGDLFVESDVTTAGDFLYDGSRNRTLNIPGVAFVSAYDADDDSVARRSDGYVSVTGGSAGYGVSLVAEVQLPAGASISDLTCAYRDTSLTADLTGTVTLNSRGFLDAGATSLGLVSLGMPGLDTAVLQQVSTAISATVNSNNSYFLYNTFTPGELGLGIRFYGCKITYAVNGIF
ncbi:MAG: hypothetical protein JRH19_26560 [Deltaproteobacteria bacterium]|nr:hypothetical protein [Deltaproteobacteria bacterium]